MRSSSRPKFRQSSSNCYSIKAFVSDRFKVASTKEWGIQNARNMSKMTFQDFKLCVDYNLVCVCSLMVVYGSKQTQNLLCFPGILLPMKIIYLPCKHLYQHEIDLNPPMGKVKGNDDDGQGSSSANKTKGCDMDQPRNILYCCAGGFAALSAEYDSYYG